jgi:hypothetical protein
VGSQRQLSVTLTTASTLHMSGSVAKYEALRLASRKADIGGPPIEPLVCARGRNATSCCDGKRGARHLVLPSDSIDPGLSRVESRQPRRYTSTREEICTLLPVAL